MTDRLFLGDRQTINIREGAGIYVKGQTKKRPKDRPKKFHAYLVSGHIFYPNEEIKYVKKKVWKYVKIGVRFHYDVLIFFKLEDEFDDFRNDKTIGRCVLEQFALGED